MAEKVLLSLASILISCMGIFIFLRPVFISEKMKNFYSNYPIIKYAGDSQLTTRSGFMKIVGAVLFVVGIICLFSIL
jgi:hypothetical protein